MEKLNNFIIILGSGINQLPFVAEAKKQGFQTIVFDVEKKIASDKADIFYNISIYNTNEIIILLEKLNYNYKAIIARVTSAQGLFTGHTIAKKYNLTFASQTLLKLGTDKTFLANFCKKNNIPIPNTKILKEFNEIKTLTLEKNSDYIIKPAMTKIGKKNIIKFQTKQELENIFSLTSSVSDNQEVLLQKYIDGVDVGVFTIFNKNSFKIIATLDEINTLDEEFKVKAIGLHTPSLILQNPLVMKKINSIISTFNKLLPNEQYFSAFSFRIDKNNNIFLIEIHTDLTGDLVMDKLLPSANFNFNFFKLYINFLIQTTDTEKYTFQNTLLIFDDKIYINNLNILKLKYPKLKYTKFLYKGKK